MDPLDQIDEALGNLSSNQRPPTATDQPTTEASVVQQIRHALSRQAEPMRYAALDYPVTAVPMARVLEALDGIEKALTPAPQPAADTERDERLREARAQAVRCRKQPRSQGVLHPDQERLVTLDDEITRLDAVVTAVRELHRVQWDHCQGCYDSTGRLVAYPCATVRALDGVL